MLNGGNQSIANHKAPSKMPRDEEYPSFYTPGVDYNKNPQDHIAAHLCLAMAEEAKRQGKRMLGQLAVETDNGDCNVMFAGYGNGDCYCWFVEMEHFVLIAHIEERWKTLGLHHINHAGEFQVLVNEIANQLNLKHGYPIEEPDDFKPSAPNDENPPDEANR
jgi:hypothetical protein